MHVVYPVLHQGNGVLMRTLGMQEVQQVSGGAEIWWDLGVWGGKTTTEEIGEFYDTAVDAMTDFFEWWDPAGYYNRS